MIQYQEQQTRAYDATLPASAAKTPPSSWYTRPEFVELDNATVFSNYWIMVGRVDELLR